MSFNRIFFILFFFTGGCFSFSPTHTTPILQPHNAPANRIKSIHRPFQLIPPKQILEQTSHFRSKTPFSLHALHDANDIATSLGYVVGAASLLLYSPIAFRIIRQGTAEGLSLSTWWFKLCAYTCTDLYAFSRHYPLSTYIETIIITIQSIAILLLAANAQHRINDKKFLASALTYGTITSFIIFSGMVDSTLLSLGQAASTTLHMGAVFSQLSLNFERRSSGDYSPLTAAIAMTGCIIRLFTTNQLADADPLLLGGFGLGVILNGSLLSQILWFGMKEENMGLREVLLADFLKKEEDEKVGRERLDRATYEELEGVWEKSADLVGKVELLN